MPPNTLPRMGMSMRRTMRMSRELTCTQPAVASRVLRQGLVSASSSLPSHHQRRQFSVATHRTSATTGTPSESASSESSIQRLETPPPPPQRWIAELRARIGKIVIFGCDNAQVSRTAAVLRALALEWKDLLAGSEGFLTGGRRGLDGQKVAWGEMDSFVSASGIQSGDLRRELVAIYGLTLMGRNRAMSTTSTTTATPSLRGSTGLPTLQCMSTRSTARNGMT